MTANVTIVEHVTYSVRLNVTGPDGTVHKVGTSHRERRWWCYSPCGNATCPHIPPARHIAHKALPQ